jgi:hypothetical protein
VHFNPVLLDADEIPPGEALRFTWARVPYAYRRGGCTRLRVKRGGAWEDCPQLHFDPQGVTAVEAEVALDAGEAA